MYTAEQILEMVNRALDGLRYDRQPASLYDPIKYVLSAGGKRLRPVLMLLSYNMYKEHPEDILNQALGLETFHNFTLLHDDLMDNADIRRGRPTVHLRWDANTAILSGDAMVLLAYQLMQTCDARHLPDVMSLFTQTALEIQEGQQLDIGFEKCLHVTEEEYLEMIRLKTSVLLACALKTGAILGDASEEDARLLYLFGEKTGLAFQLQDDLLDVYGDPEVFGKAIGGDIVSNKKTYMLINALNRANGQQRAELTHCIEATGYDRQEKIAAVTRLYDEIGIRQLCEERISNYFEQGKEFLGQVGVSSERKEQLRQYTAAMMTRKY